MCFVLSEALHHHSFVVSVKSIIMENLSIRTLVGIVLCVRHIRSNVD